MNAYFLTGSQFELDVWILSMLDNQFDRDFNLFSTAGIFEW